MAKPTPKYPHVEKAHAYMKGALSGAVDVCELVKMTVRRHFYDLEKTKDPDFPYYFDESKASRVCRFVEMMVHTKGKWQRARLTLEPWQCFVLCVAFGWMRRSDQKRRFREVYIEIPRKNGKSALSAAVGNYMFTADGELGAEVYSGASSEKQAWEVFGPARTMAKWNEDYTRAYGIEINARNMSILSLNSKFEPLIGDPGDGSSPHCAIVDEFHEHDTPNQYDTMRTGMGAREQPLLWIITTAGTNTAGPCYAKRIEAVKVLQDTVQNDELFPVIYTIDDADDWKNFSVWRKANPNFGVSVFEDYLRGQYREAMQRADRQNANRCKHLNVWSNAAVGWINMAKWDTCAVPGRRMEDFAGVECWCGVDLASKIDLAALLFLFRIPDSGPFAEFTPGNYFLFAKHYLPEETAERPENAHYRAWHAEGLLTLTPGARTDFSYLEDDLRDAAALFPIQELAYDPREAEYLMQNIRQWASFPCIEVPQSPAHISEPMKEFEALYLSGRMHHDGNAMLRWQASNVIRKDSKNKSFYPAKERDVNKIDAMVAAIMALSRAMLVKAAPSFGMEVW